MTTNPFQALEDVIQLGFRRILTSGQKETALEGSETIRRLREAAGDRVIIMAGAGVTENNARTIVDSTGVNEIHGSASEERPGASLNRVKMGSGPESSGKRVTSAQRVASIAQSFRL